jgi:hypothetical protein
LAPSGITSVPLAYNTAQEAMGHHLSLLYMAEDSQRGWAQHNLREAVKSGFYKEETWRRKKDGSLFWARIALTALKDHASGAGRPLRIMVVDDNTDAADMLALLLGGVGHIVSTHHGAEAALEYAQHEPADVYLLASACRRSTAMNWRAECAHARRRKPRSMSP